MKAQNQVIEWAPFKLREGVAESTLVAASDAFQREFLSRQDGFIERHLVKGADGQWVDVAHWDSLENANKAVQNAGEDPTISGYFSLMADPDVGDPSTGLLHLHVIKSYP